MRSFVTILILGVVLSSTPLTAQQTEPAPTPARLLIEGGVQYGGDDLFTVFFTNGEDQTLRAGQGGSIAVGGEFLLPAAPEFRLRATAGYLFTTTAADNANIRFTRIPLNLTAFYALDSGLRFGAGISSHQSVKLRGDGFLGDETFDSSLAPRIELGYRWVALTYTNLTYTSEGGDEVNANAVGLSLSFTIPGS